MVFLPLPFLIIWTLAWFAIMEPEPTELVRAMTPESEDLPTFIYLLLSIVVLAPIQEEILYRHFAMGLFYRWFGRSTGAVLAAILVSTVIFSVAHVAILTDNWIKFVQILPAGLIFGFIYYKRGLEHSILAHALFNGLIGPASYLLELLS
jgi:membrane protease YdiL (CAAX protease family)